MPPPIPSESAPDPGVSKLAFAVAVASHVLFLIGLTWSLGRVPDVPEGPVGEGSGGGFGGGAYRLGSGVAPPILRRRVEPSYTNEGLQAKTQGTVVLDVVVRRDGTVGAVLVLQSLYPGLDRKAIAAVRQWLFVPGKFRGLPVDIIVEVVVEFRLL